MSMALVLRSDPAVVIRDRPSTLPQPLLQGANVRPLQGRIA